MKTPPLRCALLLALLTLLPSLVAGAAEAKPRQTFVLVHGATAGDWEWKRCGKFLTDDGMSLWDLFGSKGLADPQRFQDGFMQVPWVKADAKPPHNVKQSIQCFNQPVSYKTFSVRAPNARILREQTVVGTGSKVAPGACWP